MQPVFVAGTGMTRFGKHIDCGLKSLAAEARKLPPEQQAELISPLTATLSRNRKVRFKIRVPNADAVQVSVDKERFPLSQRGQDFEGDLSLPAGQATIFAHYPEASSATPGSKRFWGLVQYQVQ